MDKFEKQSEKHLFSYKDQGCKVYKILSIPDSATFTYGNVTIMTKEIMQPSMLVLPLTETEAQELRNNAVEIIEQEAPETT